MNTVSKYNDVCVLVQKHVLILYTTVYCILYMHRYEGSNTCQFDNQQNSWLKPYVNSSFFRTLFQSSPGLHPLASSTSQHCPNLPAWRKHLSGQCEPVSFPMMADFIYKIKMLTLDSHLFLGGWKCWMNPPIWTAKHQQFLHRTCKRRLGKHRIISWEAMATHQ